MFYMKIQDVMVHLLLFTPSNHQSYCKHRPGMESRLTEQLANGRADKSGTTTANMKPQT